MISCERCEELINARLDGYLTEEEALLLEEHLAQCPDCRKLDRDLTTLHERLKNLSFDLPQDFAASVMARLGSVAFQPVKRKKRPWAAAVCAAAAVLLAVAISPQVLPFGSSGADTAAGESAEAPEAMVMDSDVAPAEGGEAAPAPEESQAESENLKTEPLTQEEARAQAAERLLNRKRVSIDTAIEALELVGYTVRLHDNGRYSVDPPEQIIPLAEPEPEPKLEPKIPPIDRPTGFLDDYPDMLSPRQVSEITGLTTASVRRLCKQGKLLSSKVGGRVVINKQQFEKMFNAQ